MSKLKNIVFCFILIFIFSFGCVSFAEPVSEDASSRGNAVEQEISDEVNNAGEYIKNVLALIDNYYIGEVSVEELVKGAISGMAGKLDQYSEFLDAEALNGVLKETTNSTEGLGISYYEKFKDGYPQITNVYEGSPAQKAGILRGDVLISIDGNDLKNKSGDEITQLILQKKGSEIKAVVDRQGSRLELLPVIGDFVLPTVYVSRVEDMLEGLDKAKADKVRYIQVSSFGDNTGKEFKEVVGKLKAENIEAIIIDFRFNGGGVTQSAYEMCEALVKEGPFLNVVTKSGKYTVDSEDNDVPFKNIAVLTNESTASASELVSAVLKDNGAVVIGEKTFGKGVTQAIIELLNLGAIKMTTEEFSPMSGRKINGVGVVPDYEVSQIKVIKNDSENFDKDAEEALKALGYDITTNEKKVAIIKEIQKKYSLTETGIIDYDTISAINSEIVNKNFQDDAVLEKAVEVIFAKLV